MSRFKKIINILILVLISTLLIFSEKNIAKSRIEISPEPNPKPVPTPQSTSTVQVMPTPYRGIQIPEPITTRQYEAPFGCARLGDPHKINGYYYEDPEYDGVCWHENYDWIPGIPTIQTQFLEMPPVTSGSIWVYGPELMEATAKFHELTLEDVGEENGIAVPFCSMIGKLAWIKLPNKSKWEGPFKVVDCAGLLDLYNVIVNRQEIAEISFDKAIDWGMINNLRYAGDGIYKYTWEYRRIDNVIISFVKPSIYGDKYPPEGYQPIDLADWFKENSEFFQTQAEYEESYKPLYRYHEQKPEWKFSIDGEWIKF